jgi:bacterioferritin
VSPKSESFAVQLNDVFNRRITTALRYLVQASLFPESHPIREFYKTEIGEELRHAQYLADKIVALGGTPRIDSHVIPPEMRLSEMLKQDLAADEQDVEGSCELAALAEEAGDAELGASLEEQAADEIRHAYEIRRLSRIADSRVDRTESSI